MAMLEGDVDLKMAGGGEVMKYMALQRTIKASSVKHMVQLL